MLGPYLIPERAQCGMKRPTLRVGGTIPSLRRGPFLDMNGLIPELKGLRMGRGKRYQVYQKATVQAHYMPEALCTVFQRWSTSGLRWPIHRLSGPITDLRWP